MPAGCPSLATLLLGPRELVCLIVPTLSARVRRAGAGAKILVDATTQTDSVKDFRDVGVEVAGAPPSPPLLHYMPLVLTPNEAIEVHNFMCQLVAKREAGLASPSAQPMPPSHQELSESPNVQPTVQRFLPSPQISVLPFGQPDSREVSNVTDMSSGVQTNFDTVLRWASPFVRPALDEHCGSSSNGQVNQEVGSCLALPTVQPSDPHTSAARPGPSPDCNGAENFFIGSDSDDEAEIILPSIPPFPGTCTHDSKAFEEPAPESSTQRKPSFPRLRCSLHLLAQRLLSRRTFMQG